MNNTNYWELTSLSVSRILAEKSEITWYIEDPCGTLKESYRHFKQPLMKPCKTSKAHHSTPSHTIVHHFTPFHALCGLPFTPCKLPFHIRFTPCSLPYHTHCNLTAPTSTSHLKRTGDIKCEMGSWVGPGGARIEIAIDLELLYWYSRTPNQCF